MGLIIFIGFVWGIWAIIHYMHKSADQKAQIPDQPNSKYHQAKTTTHNINAIYKNQRPCDLNEYRYQYQGSKKRHPITAIFPKPDTKTFKVREWSTNLNAEDLAFKIYDPKFNGEISIKEDQKMFDEMFKQYIRAYIQSFSNYRDYDIQITIRRAKGRDRTLGIVNQQATLEFKQLPQKG